jgi:hypothetical protein
MRLRADVIGGGAGMAVSSSLQAPQASVERYWLMLRTVRQSNDATDVGRSRDAYDADADGRAGRNGDEPDDDESRNDAAGYGRTDGRSSSSSCE